MPKINFWNSGIRWIWLTILILVLDRISKEWAQYYLSTYSAWHVMPGFNFALSYNKGAAFSFLDSANGWQVFFFGLVAIIASISLFIWLIRISWRRFSECIALSFIIGGALGNLWDRFHYGHVVDFIQWYAGNYYWPTFNIADSAICVGAVLLIMHSFFQRE